MKEKEIKREREGNTAKWSGKRNVWGDPGF